MNDLIKWILLIYLVGFAIGFMYCIIMMFKDNSTKNDTRGNKD